MKILLVNDYATVTGGAEIQLLALRDGLRQRGHDARIFASSARPLGAQDHGDYRCFGTTLPLLNGIQVANPWAFFRLRRVLAEFQPDVVHVKMFLTQLSPLILPLLREVPALYDVVWYRPICPLGTKMLPDGSPCTSPPGRVCYLSRCLPLYKWLPLMLQMKLWRRWRGVFDLVVANSESLKRRLKAEGIEATEVVRYGVPAVPARLPLVPPPIVVFAGRLVREKGADVLVRAFARVRSRLPGARLLLAGDGPQREALNALVSDLGLSDAVRMPGHITRAEMERRFAPAWVQVVPSRWVEPFGVVAVEAMMRGTAVIATFAGGLSEIVRDGRTGLLVPPGDVDRLAGALLRLLQNREEAEAMGRAGREVALASYNDVGSVEAFSEIYRRLRRKSG